MQVQEIMTRGAEVIDPNMTIRDAARKMRTDNIGALPVGEKSVLGSPQHAEPGTCSPVEHSSHEFIR
jgi:CBS domain-containing protein